MAAEAVRFPMIYDFVVLTPSIVDDIIRLLGSIME